MNFLKKLFKTQAPPDSASTMSRNAVCWCGSGKKYKQCHFDADRTHFTAKANEGCSGST
jgi:SEC-C motif